MIAVIQTGGKQYKIKEGDLVTVERLDGDTGTQVILGTVLLIADENADKVDIGAPYLSNAKIAATITEQGRGKKIDVIKYKRKVRYRRKKGHRQRFTKIKVDSITAP